MVKKISLVLAAILSCVFLAACGEQAQGEDVRQPESTEGASQGSSEATATAAPMWVPPQSTSEKKDIMTETEQVFDASFDISVSNPDDSTENYGRVLSTQFYQGEPVLLWLKRWEREVAVASEDGAMMGEMRDIEDGGLYLYRMDGSRELLIPAGDFLKENLYVRENNTRSQQYVFVLDDAGNCYARTNYQDEEVRDHFLKIDRDGEIVYKTVIEAGYYAKDFCTAADGRSYVVLGNNSLMKGETVTRLVEFNPDTGELSQTDTFSYRKEKMAASVGEGPDGLYYYTASGYRKIEEDGSSTDYMLFQGTSYSHWTDELGWGAKDFRVLVDGSIEVLEAKSDSSYKVVKVKLWLSDNDKIPVVVRARAFSSWWKSQAARFNRTNDTYQIVLEEFINGKSGELEDYARLTNVEIASGKGPDMLYGDFMNDYICGMVDKGAVLELSSYMKASGIREEDYLPIAFDGLRDGDKIYGVLAGASPDVYKIKSEVLGENDVNIETLMNALAERRENAVFYARSQSGDLLRMFLKGSENLWGMIDWEAGTCDFDGELFAKIMENAKRYGYDGRNKYPNLVQSMSYTTLTRYDSLEELKKEGMTRLGVLLDDGCYGATDLTGTMMINANSAQKDGAWEFIVFLLEEEAQVQQSMSFPVNRAALPVWVQKSVQRMFENDVTAGVGSVYIEEDEIVKKYKEYTYEDMTEERIAEYLSALEEVRSLPYRTAPVLDIICEEAESYFNGSKSIRDVNAIIENRVRLYLEERK